MKKMNRPGMALALPLDEMQAENPTTLPWGGQDHDGGDAGDHDTITHSVLGDIPPQERVNEVVIGLMRQHLHHVCGKDDAVTKAFEAKFPRGDNSIVKKSLMTKSLGIHSHDHDSTVLTKLVSQTLGPQGGGKGSETETQPALGGASEDFGASGQQSSVFHYAEDGSSLDVNGMRFSNVSSIPFSVVGSLEDLDLNNAQELGKGASGAVYKAKHHVNGTYHAVKKIIVGSEESVAQIKAEISVLWGCTNTNSRAGVSPFVIHCHGVFFAEGALYIAMECMERSLKDALDKFGTVPEEGLRAIAFQSLRGLRYLHYEKKQLHRDIKPHNILYNKEGVCKVSDFGIASEKMETLQCFQKGTFCGTMIYMSPDRAKGDNYSYEADIWSLGVTLMQLTLGKIDFAKSIFGIARLKTNPPKMPAANPDTGVAYSAECQDFINSCLNPDAKGDTLNCKVLLEHPWMVGMDIDKSKESIVKHLVK